MSFTNSTTNYHLPQYITTDIPTYLVDQNGAWETIDTNLKRVDDAATSANALAHTAQEASATATAAVNAYKNDTTLKVGDSIRVLQGMMGISSRTDYITVSVVLPFAIAPEVSTVTVTSAALRGNGTNITSFTISDAQIVSESKRCVVSCHVNADIVRYHAYGLADATISFA